MESEPFTPRVAPSPLQELLPELLRQSWSSNVPGAHALVLQAPPGSLDPDFVLATLCRFLDAGSSQSSRVFKQEHLGLLDDIACWALAAGANPGAILETGPEDASGAAPVLAWLLANRSPLPHAIDRLLAHPSAHEWLAATHRGRQLDTCLLALDQIDILEKAAASGLRPSHGKDGAMAWEAWVPASRRDGTASASSLAPKVARLKRLGWLPEGPRAFREASARMSRKNSPSEARTPGKMEAVGRAMGVASQSAHVALLSTLLTVAGLPGREDWGLGDHALAAGAVATLSAMNERQALAPLEVKRGGALEHWSPAAAMLWAMLVTHAPRKEPPHPSAPGLATAADRILSMLDTLPADHPSRTFRIGGRKGRPVTPNGLLWLLGADAGSMPQGVTQQEADEALGSFLAIAPSMHEQMQSGTDAMAWRSQLAKWVMKTLSSLIDSETSRPRKGIDPAWLSQAWLDLAAVRCRATASDAAALAGCALVLAQQSGAALSGQAWTGLASTVAVPALRGTQAKSSWIVPSGTETVLRDALVSRACVDTSAAMQALHIKDCPALDALLPPARVNSAAAWLGSGVAADAPEHALRAGLLMLAWSCAGMGKPWLDTRLHDLARQVSTKERESVGIAVSQIMALSMHGQGRLGSTCDPQIAAAFVEVAARALCTIPDAGLESMLREESSAPQFVAALLNCANVCAAAGVAPPSEFARASLDRALGAASDARKPSWAHGPYNPSHTLLLATGWKFILGDDNRQDFHPSAGLAWLGMPMDDPDGLFKAARSDMRVQLRAPASIQAAAEAAEAKRRLDAAPGRLRPRLRA